MGGKGVEREGVGRGKETGGKRREGKGREGGLTPLFFTLRRPCMQ